MRYIYKFMFSITWYILSVLSLIHVDKSTCLIISLDWSDLVEGLTRLFSLTVHQLLSWLTECKQPSVRDEQSDSQPTVRTPQSSRHLLGNGLLIHDNVITRSWIKTQPSTLNLIYSSQDYRPPEGWDRRIISHLCRIHSEQKDEKMWALRWTMTRPVSLDQAEIKEGFLSGSN